VKDASNCGSIDQTKNKKIIKLLILQEIMNLKKKLNKIRKKD
jgi:hypothetical protein